MLALMFRMEIIVWILGGDAKFYIWALKSSLLHIPNAYVDIQTSGNSYWRNLPIFCRDAKWVFPRYNVRFKNTCFGSQGPLSSGDTGDVMTIF